MNKTRTNMEGIDFNIIEGMDEQQAKDWFKGTEDPVTRDLLSGATRQEMADFVNRMQK